MNISYKILNIDYLDQVCDLENNGYPPDEAGSRSSMEYRLNNANDYFLGVFLNDNNNNESKLIGYVCGTLTKGNILTHDTMFKHDKEGRTLCIHSVLTKNEYKRKGIASNALKYYIEYIQSLKTVDRITLIAKEYLLNFYSICGFKLIGKSDVVHGKDQWYEMTIDL